MTLIASAIAQQHLLVQDDQNDMKHDFFCNLKLLALASALSETTVITNGIKGLIGKM